jgi:hypothetical protein
VRGVAGRDLQFLKARFRNPKKCRWLQRDRPWILLKVMAKANLTGTFDFDIITTSFEMGWSDVNESVVT